jgi:hypothetical protein
MDLVRQGVLEQLPGRRRCELTAKSLREWMATRDPLLDQFEPSGAAQAGAVKALRP